MMPAIGIDPFTIDLSKQPIKFKKIPRLKVK